MGPFCGCGWVVNSQVVFVWRFYKPHHTVLTDMVHPENEESPWTFRPCRYTYPKCSMYGIFAYIWVKFMYIRRLIFKSHSAHMGKKFLRLGLEGWTKYNLIIFGQEPSFRTTQEKTTNPLMTPPETNVFCPLKMDAWKTIVSFLDTVYSQSVGCEFQGNVSHRNKGPQLLATQTKLSPLATYPWLNISFPTGNSLNLWWWWWWYQGTSFRIWCVSSLDGLHLGRRDAFDGFFGRKNTTIRNSATIPSMGRTVYLPYTFTYIYHI